MQHWSAYFVPRAILTATILDGTTSATVAHGLGTTPNIVLPMPYGDIGSQVVTVTYDDTNIYVSVLNPPFGANFIIKLMVD